MACPFKAEFISDAAREQLISELVYHVEQTMFGDGLEREYILDGFPQFVGLNHRSDEELFEIARELFDEPDGPAPYSLGAYFKRHGN